ncbi:unnamed protein product [Gongylonema pulchrum]|uniref:Lipoyl-binding domain-containing protein n=1 Tax=Gongylonema pulchrum TaxID=637853 RepID=A0A183DPE4_9BILA|nr:unnamed protein product [Gongylonema pulchrum]
MPRPSRHRLLSCPQCFQDVGGHAFARIWIISPSWPSKGRRRPFDLECYAERESCFIFRRAASTSRLTPLFGIPVTRLQHVQGNNKQLYRMYASGLPDHRLITMPALSPTMEHGTLVNWQKKEGDEVAEGEIICEIETDKSVMAFEAAEEGFLAKVLVPAGTKGIKIGKPICVFVDKKEDCGAFANFKAEGKIP